MSGHTCCITQLSPLTFRDGSVQHWETRVRAQDGAGGGLLHSQNRVALLRGNAETRLHRQSTGLGPTVGIGTSIGRGTWQPGFNSGSHLAVWPWEKALRPSVEKFLHS